MLTYPIWHRFLMDVPYELILALGIYPWGPQQRHDTFFDDGRA